MNIEVGNKSAARAASVGSALRGAGRVALWALVGLLLVRGVLATAAGPRAEAPAQPRERQDEQAADAFAVRFARAYLSDPSADALAPLLAEGAHLEGGRPPAGGEAVAQAEVTASEALGAGRTVYTVACELYDSRTFYLAVPTARSEAGGVAALGSPWLVAGPGPGGPGVEADRPRPLAGPEAGEIGALARRFAQAYLSARSAGDLSYYLAPGAAITPLGGGMRYLSTAAVGQLGSGEGRRRTVVARVKVEDSASGAIYPLAFRLELVRGARWYVSKLAGALS